MATAMPNHGTPESTPTSRRPSLRPPSPTSEMSVVHSQARRGSKLLYDTKTHPSVLRWEILNRILALSVKGDWCAVDQHLNSLGRNNMEMSSTEIEVIIAHNQLLSRRISFAFFSITRKIHSVFPILNEALFSVNFKISCR